MSFLAHNKNSTSLSLGQKDLASLKAPAGLEAMFLMTLVTPLDGHLLLLPPHHHSHHPPTIATCAALLGEHPRFVLPSGQTPIERHYLIPFKISPLSLTCSAFRRFYTRSKCNQLRKRNLDNNS